MTKKALAVISFGTTYPQAREAIGQIEKALSAALPDYDFFRAFTSGMVIRKIEREEGIKIPNPAELMQHLSDAGYEKVLCQSLHVMPGFEYEKMLAQLAPYREKFTQLSVGKPARTTMGISARVCCATCPRLPRMKPMFTWDTAPSILLMRHTARWKTCSAFWAQSVCLSAPLRASRIWSISAAA